MISKYLSRTPYVREAPKIGRNETYGGTYRKSEDAVWQLFGHVHSGPNGTGIDADRLKYLFPTQYDVGVDNNNYIPVSYIQHIIEKQVNESN